MAFARGEAGPAVAVAAGPRGPTRLGRGIARLTWARSSSARGGQVGDLVLIEAQGLELPERTDLIGDRGERDVDQAQAFEGEGQREYRRTRADRPDDLQGSQRPASDPDGWTLRDHVVAFAVGGEAFCARVLAEDRGWTAAFAEIAATPITGEWVDWG